MKNSKVLEMLKQNQIDELITELQDEIFAESLASVPNAKKRYAAMKRYLSYVDSTREVLKKASEIELDGVQYTVFCNSYSLALSKESCGEIEKASETERYPDVTNLVKYDGSISTLDISRVIAEAKSQGYKLRKTAILKDNYLMRYDGAYFRIGLLDAAYSIIDDGKEATVYHVNGARRPLTITTDIGVCVVMPMYIDGEPEEDVVVIEAK